MTDLVDPTAAEVADALSVALDSAVVDGLAAPSGRAVRPSVEGQAAAVLVVLAVPVPPAEDAAVAYAELGIVVTRDEVLTIRKTGPEGQLAGAPAIATDDTAAQTAGEIAHRVVDDVCDRFLDMVDGLYGAIDELEDEVDALGGPAVRRRLVELRHELLAARRTASATRAVVRRIVDGRADAASPSLFGGTVEHRFVDTYETLVRTTEELDIARDLLSSVRDFQQAKIAESQNDVGKKLTVVASLVLVPSLIVGFYGQNFAGAFDAVYWSLGVSVGLIVVTTIAQLAVFRWRRWI